MNKKLNLLALSTLSLLLVGCAEKNPSNSGTPSQESGSGQSSQTSSQESKDSQTSSQGSSDSQTSTPDSGNINAEKIKTFLQAVQGPIAFEGKVVTKYGSDDPIENNLKVEFTTTTYHCLNSQVGNSGDVKVYKDSDDNAVNYIYNETDNTVTKTPYTYTDSDQQLQNQKFSDYINPFDGLIEDDISLDENGTFTFKEEKQYSITHLLSMYNIDFKTLSATYENNVAKVEFISDTLTDLNNSNYTLSISLSSTLHGDDVKPLEIPTPLDKTTNHDILKAALKELKDATSYTITHDDQITSYQKFDDEGTRVIDTTNIKKTFYVTEDTIFTEYDKTNSYKQLDFGFHKVKDDSSDETISHGFFVKNNKIVNYYNASDDDALVGDSANGWDEYKCDFILPDISIESLEDKGDGLFETKDPTVAGDFANMFAESRSDTTYTAHATEFSIKLVDSHVSEVNYTSANYIPEGDDEQTYSHNKITISNLNSTVKSIDFSNVDWDIIDLNALLAGTYKDGTGKVFTYSEDGTMKLDENNVTLPSESEFTTTEEAFDTFLDYSDRYGEFAITIDETEYPFSLTFNLYMNPTQLELTFDDEDTTPEGYDEYLDFDLFIEG